MVRIGAIFIAICMVLIAASLGGVLFLAFKLPAAMAGIAALDLYREEDLFARANKLEAKWADAAMTLKGLPNVLDVRQVGLTAAVDMASKPDAVGRRGYDAMEHGFHEQGIMIRTAGDTLAVTPPLTVSEAQIGEIFDKLATLIRQVA